MLNEMVQSRPYAPYSWLAQRMRMDGSGVTPAVGTVPVLPPAAKLEFGGDLEKTWGFVLGLQARGGSAPAPAAAAAAPAKAKAAKPKAPEKESSEVVLSICEMGDGVFLAIRPPEVLIPGYAPK